MVYKVLVVDDSLPMRSVLKKTIKASGFGSAEFFEAANGQEALLILKKEWLDIVVTDYNMPEMNGLELIQEMKKDDLIQAIPVLVITTESSRMKIDEFIEMGAAGYIKKPFTPEEIKAKFVEILGESNDDTGIEESDNNLDF
ncbi:MAG: response regulator [Proteobacteria bacterium]|nr:response regulator [Pseudomonadota bacterium]